jgi:TPR repeat protein
MRRLGSLHRIGACGLQPDDSKALLWYERAAATGDVDSIAILAFVLQEVGDLARAVMLFHKAAESGSAAAMFNLALCYENGTGVTKSAEKAVELYERAIELGHAGAMVNLAVCYENGTGVTKSVEKAVELYERATELGDASAMVQPGVVLRERHGRDEERRESGRAVRARS